MVTKKQISFKATLEIECDEDWNPETFDEVEDSDYDNVGRPLNRLEDEGWIISNKKIKTL